MLKNTEKSGKPQITSENSGVRWETWIMEHAQTLSELRPTSLVSLLFKGPDISLRFSSVPIKGFIGLMPLPFTLYGSDKKLFLQEKATEQRAAATRDDEDEPMAQAESSFAKGMLKDWADGDWTDGNRKRGA